MILWAPACAGVTVVGNGVAAVGEATVASENKNGGTPVQRGGAAVFGM